MSNAIDAVMDPFCMHDNLSPPQDWSFYDQVHLSAKLCVAFSSCLMSGQSLHADLLVAVQNADEERRLPHMRSHHHGRQPGMDSLEAGPGSAAHQELPSKRTSHPWRLLLASSARCPGGSSNVPVLCEGRWTIDLILRPTGTSCHSSSSFHIAFVVAEPWKSRH